MYHEIHRMSREGHSISKICRIVLLDWRTVRHYLSMTEADFDAFMNKQSERKKELLPYEEFIKSKLQKYSDTSCAQMHDWLKEHFTGFPSVSAKTVFNFISWIRQKHQLPKLNPAREYEMVEETSYGKQAQVDFGEYNLRDNEGKRVKVFFFTSILSRSRYKYVWFSDQCFTTELAIEAHEKAFAFFGGIPDEIVYDQDKVFIVSENKGDIILTDRFKAYVKERSFKLHFCRKSDPESKGKIENVVKYTKQNFLYNRAFDDIETLNAQALAWLGRTANVLTHRGTAKQPCAEWEVEKAFLVPYIPYASSPQLTFYTLRKDNTISWKGNFYSVPLGTYKGKGSKVSLSTDNDYLIIKNMEAVEICRHLIATGKGLKVKNTDHSRDKSAAIKEMIESACNLLDHPEKGLQFLSAVKTAKPRYIRDQIILFRNIIEDTDKQIVEAALDCCQQNNIESASDFKAIVAQYSRENNLSTTQAKVLTMNPLNRSLPTQAFTQPATSDIEDYERILQNKQ